MRCTLTLTWPFARRAHTKAVNRVRAGLANESAWRAEVENAEVQEYNDAQWDAMFADPESVFPWGDPVMGTPAAKTQLFRAYHRVCHDALRTQEEIDLGRTERRRTVIYLCGGTIKMFDAQRKWEQALGSANAGTPQDVALRHDCRAKMHELAARIARWDAVLTNALSLWPECASEVPAGAHEARASVPADTRAGALRFAIAAATRMCPNACPPDAAAEDDDGMFADEEFGADCDCDEAGPSGTSPLPAMRPPRPERAPLFEDEEEEASMMLPEDMVAAGYESGSPLRASGVLQRGAF
jgi:hypothetical protein